MLEQNITKWGDTLVVKIPISLAMKTNLKEGSNVEIDIIEGNIIIKPKIRNKYTLEFLLEGMTADNFHREIETGGSVGNEIW